MNVKKDWRIFLANIQGASDYGSCLRELSCLREEIEFIPANEHGEFVASFVPCALKKLENIPKSLLEHDESHLLRFSLLGVLRIIPSFNEHLHPYLDLIVQSLFNVMKFDSEDNAAEAMQLFTDLSKSCRSSMEQYIPLFLDFILLLMSDFERICKLRLSISQDDIQPILNIKSVHFLTKDSFRLIHDAPIMIVLLFQLHRRFINEYIPKFVPIVLNILLVDIEQPQTLEPKNIRIEEIGNQPASKSRIAFNEYISAQTKVLSFLAYIARGFAPSLTECKDVIPKIVVRLLRRCPTEGASARKELLVAIRHILSTELRQSFTPHLETLMDEKLLLGDSYSAFYIFRPAAYSMLADLIHHVRMDLPSPLIIKVISMYSLALHDPNLPNGIQTMAIKLLLNFVDVLNSEKFPLELRRPSLMRILSSIALKFDWMQNVVSGLISKRRSSQLEVDSQKESPPTLDTFKYDQLIDEPVNLKRPIPTDATGIEFSRDNVRDLKLQLKTLIAGFKNLILALRTLPISTLPTVSPSNPKVITAEPKPSPPQPSSKVSAGESLSIWFTLSESERYLVKLFRDGICCFDLFLLRQSLETEDRSNPANSIPADEKEMMDQFGYVFSLLDPVVFNDVIAANMDFFIERTKENIALVSVPQYFLAIAGVSKNYASILAKHLMERFDEIGSSNPINGAIILRLFKLLFLAVSVYPEENESVLQPYLSEIILNCFRHYPKAASPANYFMLLRSLFRSIGGGRFDSLYKEVLPLLQTILDELTNLPSTTSDQNLRDLYVELCLTTPVRLSNLLPFLSYLMKPVLLALKSGTDLVNQGLRTFELCIDNLTPDFLEPILAPVISDVIGCLWKMLKPPPANQLHSHTAVRLLGKLGGKSRKYITTSPTFNFRKNNGSGFILKFQLDFPQSKTISVSCDSLAAVAMNTLNNSTLDIFTRRQALNFLKCVIANILGTLGLRGALEYAAEKFVEGFPASTLDTSSFGSKMDINSLSESELIAKGRRVSSISCTKNGRDSAGLFSPESAKLLFCEVICSLFDGCSQADLRDEIGMLLQMLYRVGGILWMVRQDQSAFNAIDFDLLSDILMEYTTVHNETQVELAWDILQAIFNQYCLFIPDREKQFSMKILFLLADKSVAACFRVHVWQRIAACRTISKLCDFDLSIQFFWHHEIRFIRGILYVMKSLPSGTSSKYHEELTGIVFKVLRLANRLDENQVRTEEFMQQRRQFFEQLMLALVTELSNPNSIVRDTVKASFQLLGDIQGCEVTDLLSPLKSRVYGPIFSKPLRALPLHVQVGYIDAITYCLSLRPPLLDINDELVRLINEAIAVIESDDQALVTRTNQIYNASNVLNLRVVCIKLLSTCLSGVEFQQPRLHPLRNQIVAIFFKTLYARQPEIVEISRASLEQVMAHQHKLPTELLQNGLRPVLQSLGEPRNLNLVAVEGLRRILQLFSHFFKAEIGKKLLDYLHVWAEQQQQTFESGNRTNSEGPDVRVITTIMELFCLLPNCGQLFMGDLFNVVIQLESVLKKKSSSPFRPVLLKFMELYPQEAIALLVDQINNEAIVSLFASLFSSPSSFKVLNEMGKSLNPLVQAFLNENNSFELKLNYMMILYHFYSRCGPFIADSLVDQHVTILSNLWDFLGRLILGSMPSLSYSESFISKLVVDITFLFMNARPNNVDCAFLIIQGLSIGLINDHTYISTSFSGWLGKLPHDLYKALFSRWLNLPDSSAAFTNCTKTIIIPLMDYLQKVRSDVISNIFDENILTTMDKKMWSRGIHESCILMVEELQFSFMFMELIKNFNLPCTIYYERIWRFLLTSFQSVDFTVHYSTIYVMAKLLIDSSLDETALIHLLSSLLRCTSNDVKAIMKQTFDLLFSYSVDHNDIRPNIMQLISKCLGKDGTLLSLILSIWQSLCQYQDLLSENLSVLLSPVVNSFSRYSFAAFTSSESRMIPLKLADTLLNLSHNLGEHSPLKHNIPLLEALINGIIRLICSISDYSDVAITDQAISLLSRYMESFGGLDIRLRLSSLEKLFSPDLNDEQQFSVVIGIRLLKTIVSNRRQDLLLLHEFPQFARWVISLSERNGAKVVDPLGGFLTLLSSKISPTASNSYLNTFRENLTNSIVELLNNGRNYLMAFTVLNSDAQSFVSHNVVIPVFMRSFHKLSQDFLNIQEGISTNSSDLQQLHNQQVLVSAINYGVCKLQDLSLSRTSFFSILQRLWEQNLNPTVAICLLNHCLVWIKSSDPLPSLRDKVDLLLLPSKVQKLDNQALNIYLDIIYEIYSNPLYMKTELRSRLEGSFLFGLCSSDYDRRKKFMDLYDNAIPRNIPARLRHIFETQRWELMGSKYWIPVLIETLLRSTGDSRSCFANVDSYQPPDWNNASNKGGFQFLDDFFRSMKESIFTSNVKQISLLTFLASLDGHHAHQLYVSLFSNIWHELGDEMRTYLSFRFIKILASDSYLTHSSCRPNVIMTFVSGLADCDPLPNIPPHLLAYAAKTYCSWYSVCRYLERLVESSPILINPSDISSREQPWLELISSLGATYRFLGERDFMFGIYRTGFILNETNIALSFDQLDLSPYSQKLVENIMGKCRAGTIPLCEAEFSVWEDTWVSSAKKLQQWDLLTDISRASMDSDLGLECLWRLADWSASDTHLAATNLLKTSSEPTSRSKFLESFLALNQFKDQPDRINIFQSSVEEALQLALNEWQQLPQTPCPSHGDLLHTFQMLVEVQESVTLYSNLASSNSSVAINALSRPQFISDLKGLLTAWRERLPNHWDDMNLWSDILAWRQHIFSIINSAFSPLISESFNANNQGSTVNGNLSTISGTSSTHPFAFRGYHEMAWLINRFAHIARKNGLIDVCLSFLNRIYTLPNIEIQDAFLKLREQAKCYMDNPSDLPTALEVVNATNLNYFSSLQKGEFFSLRSVILSRLGMVEEANRVFAQAVQIDLNTGHGWAAWGRFNDQRFSQNQDINFAVNAINCYLQAATLFKADKSRLFLARILWLLTFEDSSGSLGKSFEMYNHDLPTWFWVAFVPQLLLSLSRKEQRQARFVLIKIAKNYPQALYLPLRTFYEDCRIQFGSRTSSSARSGSTSFTEAQEKFFDSAATAIGGTSPQISQSPNTPNSQGNASQQNPNAEANAVQSKKHPMESAEDLFSILKTGYPLLALTMENAMEHIIHRLRSTVEEDFYRVITSLVGEAYQHIMNRISGHSGASQAVTLMEGSLKRVFMMICNSTSLGPIYKDDFEKDFLLNSTDPNEILSKLLFWRSKLKPKLAKQSNQLTLDGLSRFLAEFEYHRYDEIDVPGQYLLMKDGNQDFVKIEKFDCLVSVIRRHGTSYRRILIRGNDGQVYPFAIQNPSGRQTRREERILQLLRFLDVTLKKGLATRRRELYFNIPTVVSISSHVRLVSDDPSHITYEEILENYCQKHGFTNDEIFLFFKEQILSNMPPEIADSPRINVELLNLRTDVFTHILNNIAPDNILSQFMNSMTFYSSEHWTYRRNFIRQLGIMIFQNYVFSIGHRFLHKIGFSKKTTGAVQSEVLPMVTASGQISLIEIVPFRYTPNLQHYVTPIGTEGVLLSSIVACARRFSKSDSDLCEFLSVFIRDELLLWYLNYCSIQQQQQQQQQQQNSQDKAEGGDINNPKQTTPGNTIIGEIVENPFEKLEASGVDEKAYYNRIQQNCELILKRVQTISCIKEQEQVMENPVVLFQTMFDLLSSATNPQKLAQMDGHWHPWF